MSEQNAVAHLAYDWMIVTYFFFGGISVGAYMFSVAANYWKQELKSKTNQRNILLSMRQLPIIMKRNK